MRILHVMAGAKNGASESVMLDSVLALAEAGVAQHVVTRDNSHRRLRALQQSDVPYSIADFDKIVRGPTRARVAAAIRAFEPDVMHYWLGRAAGYAPSKWRAISIGWHSGRHKLARFKNCCWHAAANDDIAHRIVAEGVDEARVATLPPFVQVDTSEPIARSAAHTPEEAVVVLALDVRGGAWEAIFAAMADNANLHVWCDAPIGDRIMDQAQKGGLAARLHPVTGLAPRLQIVAASDFVVCESAGVGLGKAAIEAGALQKPVLLLGPGGFARHETDALIAPRDDNAAIVAGLRRLTSDADLVRRLSENGRRAYRAHFTKPAFVRNAMALYERVRATARPRDAEAAA